MDISEFPLTWRWTQSSHAMLPDHILAELQPLDLQSVLLLTNNIPSVFVAEFSRFAAVNEVATRQWLMQLDISSPRVTVVWRADLALSMPWTTFCQYWDDFCYPSSDNADIFLECGRLFLRWRHFEVFECDPELYSNLSSV